MKYCFDQCTLDTERLEFRRAGEDVGIEPQVFRLLAYLIENRSRVVEKEELIEAVWAGRVISEATLNTRINAARRAVGDDGRTQAIIRTSPRRGFRFVGEVKEEHGADRSSVEDGGSLERASLPDRKPVIVVLPFQCVGHDDEGFGAGLVSRMVTELSRRTGVDVIGRQATLGLSATPADFTDIRQSTGADYVLTGIVHRIDERVRVSVELCETGRGKQIWSERYDRQLGDVFTLQDELSHAILMTVRWTMAAHDGERASRKPDSDLSTADRLSKAAQYFYTPTARSYRAAGELLDEVLASEPNHPMALSMRAFALYVSSMFDVVSMAAAESDRAKAMADRALEYNECSDFGHWVRGTLSLNLDRDHDAAMAHAERANEINPHLAASVRLKAEILCFGSDPDAGTSMLEELVDADPRAPGNDIAFMDLALARFALGQMSEALGAIDEALLRRHTMPAFYVARAAILSELNRTQDAQEILEMLKAGYENVSVSGIRRPPFRDDAVTGRYMQALSNAGMPD